GGKPRARSRRVSPRMSLPAAAIMRAAAPAALALALLPTVGTAQQMREFTSSRQRHGETRLLARIDYAAGSLRLAPGSPEHLYAISLSYDTERFRPVSQFDAASSSVQLGLETLDHSGIRVSSREQLEQSAMISLSPAVALGLDLSLGAAEAEIE